MRKTYVSIIILGEKVDVENNIDMILESIDCMSLEECCIQVSHEEISNE